MLPVTVFVYLLVSRLSHGPNENNSRWKFKLSLSFQLPWEAPKGEGNGESRIANRSCLALPNSPSPSPFSAWHAGYSRLSRNSRALSDSLAPSNFNIDWSLNSGSPLTFLCTLFDSRALSESLNSHQLSLSFPLSLTDLSTKNDGTDHLIVESWSGTVL